MARISLIIMKKDPGVVLDGGRPVTLELVRLVAIAHISRRQISVDGLIDTGSPLTVFPESVWRYFEDEIQWFRRDGTAVEWLDTVAGYTGGSFPCRLGRIGVRLIDLDCNGLDQTVVIGKFAEDRGVLPRRVLWGLAGGVLVGRRLSVEIEGNGAWLNEGPAE
jgi:hypothetical protein